MGCLLLFKSTYGAVRLPFDLFLAKMYTGNTPPEPKRNFGKCPAAESSRFSADQTRSDEERTAAGRPLFRTGRRPVRKRGSSVVRSSSKKRAVARSAAAALRTDEEPRKPYRTGGRVKRKHA